MKYSTNGSVEETRSVFLSYNEGRGAGLEKYCKKNRKVFNSISTQNHKPSKCIPVFLTWEDDVCCDRVVYGGDGISSSVFGIQVELAAIL